MLKRSELIILVLLFLANPTNANSAAKYPSEKETINVIADLILVRPASLALTLAGTALFVGFSPFAAMASIAPPHDAFARAANALVGTPACYTFHRPLGGNLLTGQESINQDFCSW